VYTVYNDCLEFMMAVFCEVFRRVFDCDVPNTKDVPNKARPAVHAGGEC
jgi:hypothetical protein